MKQPIFEEFPSANCNECQSFWSNSCDGTEVGEKRVCKAFVATREIAIPAEIKRLRKALCALAVWAGVLTALILFW